MAMIVRVIVVECMGKSNAKDVTYLHNIVTLDNVTSKFSRALKGIMVS
jgi:hypothetical protein